MISGIYFVCSGLKVNKKPKGLQNMKTKFNTNKRYNILLFVTKITIDQANSIGDKATYSPLIKMASIIIILFFVLQNYTIHENMYTLSFVIE